LDQRLHFTRWCPQALAQTPPRRPSRFAAATSPELDSGRSQGEGHYRQRRGREELSRKDHGCTPAIKTSAILCQIMLRHYRCIKLLFLKEKGLVVIEQPNWEHYPVTLHINGYQCS